MCLSDGEPLVLKESKGHSYLMLSIFCILCDHFHWFFLKTNTNIAWSNFLRTICLISFYLNTDVDRAPETSDIPLTIQWPKSKDNITIKYYTTFTNGPLRYAFLTYLTTWNIVIKMNTIFHLHHHCPVGSAAPALVICRNAGVFGELLAHCLYCFILLLVVFRIFKILCIQHTACIFYLIMNFD